MTSRRSFLTRFGAGVSATVASTVGLAGSRAPSNAQAPSQAHEELALRALHREYEQALDDGRYEAAVAFFARDAEVVFNGGLFRGREQGLARLYGQLFRSGRTGGRMEAAPGFALPREQQKDEVTIAADGRSATAVFPYSIQVGAPLESETSLASMARLQGEGVRTWWEGGLHRAVYRRNGADARWEIARLEYDTLSRADYRPGRSYARALSVAPFTACFPAERHGPDALT